jgi:DNA-binding CsgD family transcriptional regulator
MVEEDTEAAIAWGTRALELAAGLGDAEAEVYALANLGAARGQAGELDAGQAELERAHALAAQHGLEDHAGRALSLLVLGPLRPRRLARAAQHVDRAIEYCTARGLDTWRLYVVAYRSRLELLAGRWDDAGACAALALRHPRSASVARTWALTTLGLLRARRGDAGAAAALDEAEALGAGTGELFRVGPTAAARAELAWLTGDPGAIPGLTEEVLELAVRRRDPWVAGELSALRRLAGVDDGLAPALVAEPYRLVLSGDAAGAAAAWAALGCVYDEALARAQDEDPDAARAGLEALQALGARAAATVVARALRDRGVRNLPRGPRPRTRENPAGLTARELEVVALLAEGLRNAQIAERLVVADKTVDHHVSAVLRKLGASSRGEAAAAALRLGLVPTPEKDGRLDP